MDRTLDVAWSSLRPGAKGVAAAFMISGVTHLVRPQLFEPLIPPALPARRGLVLASGVAELVCAAGLVTRQSWAPAATAATLLGVWPGNWWYAIRTQRSDAHPLHKTAAWARLPLQVPMVTAALDPWESSAG
jgi:uncharacterized membrane protein